MGGETDIAAMISQKKAEFHITIRADLNRMFEEARALGLEDFATADPPDDIDDPSFGTATATLSYGDNRSMGEPDLANVWQLLAKLGDNAEVWVSISTPGYAEHADASVNSRAATITFDLEKVGGELAARIDRATKILSGNEPGENRDG